MPVTIEHVDDGFLEAYVLKRPSWISGDNANDYERHPVYSRCTHTCYVGRIDAQTFATIKAWILENCTGHVITNYSRCDMQILWHTGFGFEDGPSFVGFRLRWAQALDRSLSLY